RDRDGVEWSSVGGRRAGRRDACRTRGAVRGDRRRRFAPCDDMTTILLIEDNRGYATMLASNLEREGYEVIVAGTGAEGLEKARSAGADLIILDLMLPVMNGFTVLQRLRDEGHHTPVLVMTALGTEEEKLRGFG